MKNVVLRYRRKALFSSKNALNLMIEPITIYVMKLVIALLFRDVAGLVFAGATWHPDCCEQPDDPPFA